MKTNGGCVGCRKKKNQLFFFSYPLFNRSAQTPNGKPLQIDGGGGVGRRPLSPPPRTHHRRSPDTDAALHHTAAAANDDDCTIPPPRSSAIPADRQLFRCGAWRPRRDQHAIHGNYYYYYYSLWTRDVQLTVLAITQSARTPNLKTENIGTDAAGSRARDSPRQRC